MPKRKKSPFEGLTPDIWRRLEDIAEPIRIPQYDGTFEGKDYRGHGERFIEFCEERLIGFDYETNDFKPFRFAFWQKQIIKEAFRTKHGRLRYITIVFSWARRHGKTEDFSMYDVYRAVNYPNQQVKIGSNSATQGEETAYRWCVLQVLNAPDLRRQVEEGLIRVSKEKIEFRVTKSEIHNITSNEASAYGSRVSVAHLTEGHAAKNDKLLTALAGSVGDQKDGVVLVDSTVGGEDNYIWTLINLYEEGADDSLFVSYLSYDDLTDALKRSPEWISRAWLKSRHAQSLPGEFKKFHLNRPGGSSDPIFSRDEWRACILEGINAPLSPEYLMAKVAPRMEGGRLLFGTGLDRAQSFSKKPDRTIFTLTAKGFLKDKYYEKTKKTVTDDYGDEQETEPDRSEYWVVDSVEMPRVNDELIKKQIIKWNKIYHLCAQGFENYEINDLALYSLRMGLPVERIIPTTPNQRDAVGMLCRAVVQGRCHIPENLWLLLAEGERFKVDDSKELPHFGFKTPFKAVVKINGVKQKVFLKDDAIKSFIWSIWSMREIDSPPVGFAEIERYQPSLNEEENIMEDCMRGFNY